MLAVHVGSVTAAGNMARVIRLRNALRHSTCVRVLKIFLLRMSQSIKAIMDDNPGTRVQEHHNGRVECLLMKFKIIGTLSYLLIFAEVTKN